MAFRINQLVLHTILFRVFSLLELSMALFACILIYCNLSAGRLLDLINLLTYVASVELVRFKALYIPVINSTFTKCVFSRRC